MVDFNYSKAFMFLKDELENENLSIIHFPAICLSCGKGFENSKEFLEKTTLLPQETYYEASTNHVVDHRQCECGETLVLRRKNRRSDTKEANQKRQEFQNKLIFLVKNGVPIDRARVILMKSTKVER